jgi:hypothetical protein
MGALVGAAREAIVRRCIQVAPIERNTGLATLLYGYFADTVAAAATIIGGDASIILELWCHRGR